MATHVFRINRPKWRLEAEIVKRLRMDLWYQLGDADHESTRHVLHFAFLWLSVFIKLPFRSERTEHDEQTRFGWYWFEDCLWLLWGRRPKRVRMPWVYEWHRTSHLTKNNKWIQEYPGNHLETYDREKWSPILFSETYPVVCQGKRGDQYPANATITVAEREWRWFWLQWLPFPRRVSRDIWAKFDDEVGAGRGSYKGGTVGCGMKMLPGETPKACLDRMIATRKF
jgi:hypothetical protein